MKLKTIASVFNRHKRLTIYTGGGGGQWIGNGIAMYSLAGMPRMTAGIVLRVFDVPPDKRGKWTREEAGMPDAMSFERAASGETDIMPLSLKIKLNDATFWLFSDERQILSFNEDYIKPLLDEPEYLTFHKRETKGGGSVLALKIAGELRAVVAPAFLQGIEGYADEIQQIADLYAAMPREKVANPAQELYGEMAVPQETEPNADRGAEDDVPGQKFLVDSYLAVEK
jgi:hypothetical protein